MKAGFPKNKWKLWGYYGRKPLNTGGYSNKVRAAKKRINKWRRRKGYAGK